METALQTSSLQELECRIEVGLKTFIDVGNCLLEIRDRRLYQEKGYTRFDDYCQEQWGWGKAHVYRQIEAAKTIEIIGKRSPIGDTPQTESQVRELTPLVKHDEQEAVETWRELREQHGDNITAEIIRDTVREKLKPHISYNSGENEWYTPAEYIKAAKEVMGCIDLDPASSDLANPVVGASQYFTKEDDGLTKDWCGRVWMNPPYASGLIHQFCDKLADHYNAGQVVEAIVLVNNATETNWFNVLIECASAVMFPKGRVKYTTPSGETGAPLQGQALIYMGEQPEVFMNVFSQFGWCAWL